MREPEIRDPSIERLAKFEQEQIRIERILDNYINDPDTVRRTARQLFDAAVELDEMIMEKRGDRQGNLPNILSGEQLLKLVDNSLVESYINKNGNIRGVTDLINHINDIMIDSKTWLGKGIDK